jgi:hypothetical protein
MANLKEQFVGIRFCPKVGEKYYGNCGSVGSDFWTADSGKNNFLSGF